MELRQLRYVVRLAETLHFGKAAEKEFVAQSVISAQIAALERELGVRLFDRTSHRVSLTPAGEAFLERAHQTLLTLGEAVHEVRAIADAEARVFRVGVFGEGAGPLTHLILSAFCAQNPTVQLQFVELSMVNQLEAVTGGDVDVALLRPPIDDERVRVEPLFTEPRVAAVPRDHELAEAPDLSVDDLINQPFAVAAAGAPTGWASYWSFDDQRGERGRIAGEVRSIQESLAMIAYRGAVDTFPATAADLYQHPGVRFVPLRGAPPTSIALVSSATSRTRSALTDSLRSIALLVVANHLDLVPGAHRLESST